MKKLIGTAVAILMLVAVAQIANAGPAKGFGVTATGIHVIIDEGDGTEPEPDPEIWRYMAVNHMSLGGSYHLCAAGLFPRSESTGEVQNKDLKEVHVLRSNPDRELLCNALLKVVKSDIAVDVSVVDIEQIGSTPNGELKDIIIR